MQTLTNPGSPRSSFRRCKLITVLLIPAVVGMAVLSQPIVALLFEHGETGPDASKLIVAALLLYLPGHLLAGYDQVLIFSFYARKNTRLPVAIGVFASLSYLVVALGLFDRYQMRGLVFANTFQFAVHTLLMFWFGRRLLGRAGFVSVGDAIVRAGIASLAMGAVVWIVWRGLDGAMAESAPLRARRSRATGRCGNRGLPGRGPAAAHRRARPAMGDCPATV